VCEYCNARFEIPQPWKGGHSQALATIQQHFNAHKCKLTDSSQSALRIVRETTEDK